MREFRARDADRDRFAELIEAAHADGQIGDADRDLRVARARSAETLDELETLTRDLQRPAAAMARAMAPVPPSPTYPPMRPVGRRPGSGARRLVISLVVLAVGLGALGVVSVVLVVMSATFTSTTESSGGDVFGSDSGVVETVDAFELTPVSVRGFARAYEEEFGTSDAFEVSFFPDRIQAQVPVRGKNPRMERWTWDGDWRQDTEASAVIGPNRRVDAGSVDAKLLFANIRVARRTLDVEGAAFTHAILQRWGDEPTELNIYVSNDFGESGFLGTTPAGEITRRVPYSP